MESLEKGNKYVQINARRTASWFSVKTFFFYLNCWLWAIISLLVVKAKQNKKNKDAKCVLS